MSALMMMAALAIAGGVTSEATGEGNGDAPVTPVEPVAPVEGGEGDAYVPMDPPQVPPMPGSVEEALGVQKSSLFRRVGIASAVSGSALVVLSATAFTFGLDAERELRETPHSREDANLLLLKRDVCAAVAWPSLVLGVVGVGAGMTMVVLDEGSDP